MANKSINDLIKYSAKITNFKDIFDRADETPVGNPGINGWYNDSQSNGQDYGWYLASGMMRAMTTYGVTLAANLNRGLTCKSTNTYHFRFKINVTTGCGTAYFSPFGTHGAGPYGTGLYFDFAGGSNEVGLRIFKNGSLLASGAMSAYQDTWFDIIIRPDSFIKYKYWLDSASEPTTHNTLSQTTPNIHQEIHFRYQQANSSVYYLKSYESTTIEG